MKRSHKHIKFSRKHLFGKKNVLLLISFCFVGVIALVISRASVPSITVEPESASIISSPALKQSSQPGASNNSYIKFTKSSNGWWKPPKNTKWQWVLEGGITTSQANLSRFDMYDIDLTDAIPQTMTQEVVWGNGEKRTVTWEQGANAAEFNALKAAGKKVICYMDTGAFESYEPDAGLFPGNWGPGNSSRGVPYNGPSAYASADVIGGSSEDSAGGTFDGEFWLDIRESAWQYWTPIMWARFEVAKRIGCDGIEGDQNNSYGNDTTFGSTQAISLRLYREVYYQSHIRGLTAISKNGVELTAQQITDPTNIPYCTPGLCTPDGILNEECQQYAECSDLNPATTKGLWVGQVEYRGTSTSVCPSAVSSGRMAMKKPENYSVTENILFACWEQ